MGNGLRAGSSTQPPSLPPSLGYLWDLVVPHGPCSLPGLIAGAVAPAAEVEAERPERRHGWETCSVSTSSVSMAKGRERKGVEEEGKRGDGVWGDHVVFLQGWGWGGVMQAQRQREEHLMVCVLTYHLLVLLDDHVGVRPQEDVEVQHTSNGPPGQAWGRLQGHLFAQWGEKHNETWGASQHGAGQHHHGAGKEKSLCVSRAYTITGWADHWFIHGESSL